MDFKQHTYKIKKVKDLIPYANNSRTHSEKQVKEVAASIKEFGFTNPILTDESEGIIAGHGRVLAAELLAMDEVPCIELTGLTEAQKKAYVIADNQLALNAGWNEEMLRLEILALEELDFDTDLLGFDDKFLDELLQDDKYSDGVKGQMVAEFGFSPFSILNARSGRWQSRKKFWLDMGINSGKGRPENLISYSNVSSMGEKDTSIFDPVLCELCYKWFTPEGGLVLDPFAGGAVRGIVAAMCGRKYIGNDLREEQVIENRRQADKICSEHLPTWTVGDSRNLKRIVGNIKADAIFSCPPYADLEVYSDDPCDISTMPYDDFLQAYREIIVGSYQMLKNHSFAVWVVGEVRDKKGNYFNFVGDTVEAFKDAGFKYYNEAILVTSVGSLPLRAGIAMRQSRKLGKSHQNVLVFVKGDGKKAAERCGDIVSWIDSYEGDENDGEL